MRKKEKDRMNERKGEKRREMKNEVGAKLSLFLQRKKKIKQH